MDKLKKKKLITFMFALLSSILLPAGVPAIIFGAVYGLWVLMTFGIAATFGCFYACPLLWVSYATKRHYINLAIKIEEDGVYSIDSLADIFNQNIAKTLEEVKYLITKRYISNYLIDEEKRMLYKHEVKKELITFFCPSCGASIAKNPSNNYVCDYCHTAFEYK